MTEEEIARVRDYAAGGFSEAEQAAVRFAELLAANHTAIDQAEIDNLLRHYTERQILELGWAAAAFIGFGRLIHAFGCRPLPQSATAAEGQ